MLDSRNEGREPSEEVGCFLRTFYQVSARREVKLGRLRRDAPGVGEERPSSRSISGRSTRESLTTLRRCKLIRGHRLRDRELASPAIDLSQQFATVRFD